MSNPPTNAITARRMAEEANLALVREAIAKAVSNGSFYVSFGSHKMSPTTMQVLRDEGYTLTNSFNVSWEES